MRFCEFQLILQKSLPGNFDLDFDLNLIQVNLLKLTKFSDNF